MNRPRVDRVDLEQLAALLLDRVGLKITPDGFNGLRLALQARLAALGASDGAGYVRRLRMDDAAVELRALLPLVTVGKTEFFRDPKQFAAFETEVFPQALRRARRAGRPVRVWSAGCATGEESWSLAMVAAEQGALVEEVSVWATDLNPLAVETARAGSYPPRRLVGISEERLGRFFIERDVGYEVGPLLRALVRFDGHNLAESAWRNVEQGSFDAVFCRNVIIYFDQVTILQVMDRFYDALRPGGWLLLGYSESLFRLPTRFSMVEVGGVFLYQRPVSSGSKPEAAQPARSPEAPPPTSPTLARTTPLPRASSPTPAPAPPSPRPSVPLPTSQSSEPREGTGSTPTPSTCSPIARLDEVVRLIEEGDFPKALRTAHRLASDLPEDLAARLTLGNVHALMGSTDEARGEYSTVLVLQPLCVEARLYQAMAALQGGAVDDAKQELTRALFLEPTLCVGHYLLGQVQERVGDHEGARRSYRNAVSLRREAPRALIGHFPDLPRTNEAIAQAAQYRLAALSER